MAVKDARREQAQALDETTEEVIADTKQVMADTKRRLDDLAGAQRDFFTEASRRWVNRMQTEADLMSQLIGKLSAARSMPDAMNAYQQWASGRIEMMMADTKQLWDDAQKLMATGTKGLSAGQLV